MWHQYWDGLRGYLLATSSRLEFEALMQAVGRQAPRAIPLHNELMATVLSNINSQSTLQDNLRHLKHCGTLEAQELAALPEAIRLRHFPQPPSAESKVDLTVSPQNGSSSSSYSSTSLAATTVTTTTTIIAASVAAAPAHTSDAGKKRERGVDATSDAAAAEAAAAHSKIPRGLETYIAPHDGSVLFSGPANPTRRARNHQQPPH